MSYYLGMSGLKLEKRKILLFTDFSSEFSKSRYKEVEQELKDSETQLVAIGPEFSEDFDEEDQDEHQPGSSNGGEGHSKPPKTQPLNWNGKAKTVVQMAGEAEMAALCDGLVCSFDNAMAQLMYFEKSNKTTACWNTTLDIGAAFKIPITGRIMVQQAPIPSWKKFYRDDRTQGISKECSYHLMDERQTEVPKEEVISGYCYGTTLVPCSYGDMSRMYCSNSPRSMSVMGFTEASRVRHHLRTGNQVLAVMARGGDEPAARALSALIHALAELDMVAITRRVYSKNYNPKMGALFPKVTKDGECLLWIQLPYSMEVVSLAFPSLQSRMAKLKEEEKDAIDSLIDAMTLSQAGE
ncbi:X-ray repair cross-complementing protein 5-like [Eriocheir sinensis]|uniref:X-ray repair cross-complementing protein 5-like n=1 Tax=Eriocheir sinensis TaxID=95602 RepID=UPI0021C64279|nr:X-ray repair cross-complementing protein 5-like [Eriocheir sinensis]